MFDLSLFIEFSFGTIFLARGTTGFHVGDTAIWHCLRPISSVMYPYLCGLIVILPTLYGLVKLATLSTLRLCNTEINCCLILERGSRFHEHFMDAVTSNAVCEPDM
jgi:hypothetical protein